MALVNRRMLSRAALIGLLAVAVGLSGCGRKGALEAPPGMAAKAADGGDVAAAPAKPNKPIFLDKLLD